VERIQVTRTRAAKAEHADGEYDGEYGR